MSIAQKTTLRLEEEPSTETLEAQGSTETAKTAAFPDEGELSRTWSQASDSERYQWWRSGINLILQAEEEIRALRQDNTRLHEQLARLEEQAEDAAIHRLIVEDHATTLYYFHTNGKQIEGEGQIPLERDGTTYQIVTYNNDHQAGAAKTDDGKYISFEMTDQEAASIRQYAYSHLYRLYAQDPRTDQTTENTQALSNKTSKKQAAFTASSPSTPNDTTLEAERAQRLQAEAERDQEREARQLKEQQYKDLERRHADLYLRFHGYIDWLHQLFSNDSIPAACKLVLWYFYTTLFFLRAQPTSTEAHIGVEETAKALGISKDTVRKATDRAEMWEVLQRRYESYETENGDKRTLVHITLADSVNQPAHIKMAKLQGGKRTPKCPNCGSTDVDRYTVQYCRNCDHNAWYGQPGIRADADVIKAQNAVNTQLYRNGKKQAAFTASSSFAHITESASKHDTHTMPQSSIEVEIPQVEPFHLKKRYSKEEADARIVAAQQAPIITQPSAPASPHPQLATQHTNRDYTAICKPVRCKALWLMRHGQPAHALEKIEAERECGCTWWVWSEVDQRRICARCYTPMPDN